MNRITEILRDSSQRTCCAGGGATVNEAVELPVDFQKRKVTRCRNNTLSHWRWHLSLGNVASSKRFAS